MKLDIKYGIDIELKRVKNTLSKIDWFNEQGYKVSLPSSVTSKSKKEDIKKIIEKEFNKSDYNLKKEKLLKDFDISKDNFENELKAIFGKEISKKFKIYLTKYGSGGSYNPPNTVILNINQGINTIFHEIVHIFLEPYIQKNNVSHWEKERIVDLILNSDQFSFLNYNFWQSDYDGTEKEIKFLINIFLKI